jgi:membrane protein involved in colicin uptake
MSEETAQAPATEAAAPAAAPTTEAAPATEAAPSSTQSTPDIFSGQTQAAPSGGLISQLYDSQGELTGDWNQTLTDSEMGDYASLIGKYKSFDGLMKVC